MVGSPDVFTNDKPQGRKDDIGIHAVCCGPNNYTINAGSSTVYINGKSLKETYIKFDRRDFQTHPAQKIPPKSYFMMGDNRAQSCDSRVWGTVPRKNVIGEVFMTYWPPNRISFH